MSLPNADNKATSGLNFSRLLRNRQAAVPTEHGSWVFLFVPLVIGAALGGLRPESFLLVVTVLAAFMARQPLTLLVKVISGRRPQKEGVAGLFWLTVYGLIAAAGAAWLAVLGYGVLFWLAVPALPVLSWHLWLVSRRQERRQALVEIAGSGALSLGVIAAYWTGLDHYSPTGWLLWGLCWAQAAGTILYAYLRLEQRRWKVKPAFADGLRAGRAPLAFNLALLLAVIGLAVIKAAPAWLPLAFAIQAIETIWGIYKPAVGVKPVIVGIRQMIVSILFAVFFILAWWIG